MDLSKALDSTFNHHIAIQSSLLWIENLENKWFQSYLANRSLRFTSYWIRSGVSQGSILGLLLFLIYINDFPKVTNYFSVRRFAADDKSLTVSGQDLSELLQRINVEFPVVCEWLCNNINTIYTILATLIDEE